MEKVADLSREKCGGIVENIRSTAVYLIENQKEHIIKRRGQEFYDQYRPFFKEIVEDPDYMFKDKVHENTIILSKTISCKGKSINLVIRLAVEGDEIGLENSIITAIIENDKRYQQRLRNNFPLYKKA